MVCGGYSIFGGSIIGAGAGIDGLSIKGIEGFFLGVGFGATFFIGFLTGFTGFLTGGFFLITGFGAGAEIASY